MQSVVNVHLVCGRKADAAVQVEDLWDEIGRTHEVDILCGQVMNGFQREQESRIYERICASTPPFLPSERATIPGASTRQRGPNRRLKRKERERGS